MVQGSLNRGRVSGQIREGVKSHSLPNDGVDQLRVAIKLVLNDVVENFQQEEDRLVTAALVQVVRVWVPASRRWT